MRVCLLIVAGIVQWHREGANPWNKRGLEPLLRNIGPVSDCMCVCCLQIWTCHRWKSPYGCDPSTIVRSRGNASASSRWEAVQRVSTHCCCFPYQKGELQRLIPSVFVWFFNFADLHPGRCLFSNLDRLSWLRFFVAFFCSCMKIPRLYPLSIRTRSSPSRFFPLHHSQIPTTDAVVWGNTCAVK
jgi:hypothetical protein